MLGASLLGSCIKGLGGFICTTALNELELSRKYRPPY
jgi:hypothetical protein